MHTLELVASRTTTNSSIKEIEIRHNTTIYCSHHWFIAFRYHNSDNIVAEVNRTQYIKWAWNFGLHISNIMIKFNITNKCLQIQDLATSICILEGHDSSGMADFCHCSQWMYIQENYNEHWPNVLQIFSHSEVSKRIPPKIWLQFEPLDLYVSLMLLSPQQYQLIITQHECTLIEKGKMLKGACWNLAMYNRMESSYSQTWGLFHAADSITSTVCFYLFTAVFHALLVPIPQLIFDSIWFPCLILYVLPRSRLIILSH